jgi:hypothetical protein
VSEIERKMIWNIVRAANLTWRYSEEAKKFLSASAFNL